MAGPFGNTQGQYASSGTHVGNAGTGAYGSYHMNAGDLQYSLMPRMWSLFVPALRARGLPFKHILDVTNTVAEMGAVVKVTVAQNLTPTNLTDGAVKVLDNTPPLVAECVITDDIQVSFGVTDFTESLLGDQPTIPAVVAGALSGFLNSIEEQFVTDIINNVPAANTVGAYNTALTAGTLSAAQSVLVNNYAPREAFYSLIAPTVNAWGQLTEIPGITYQQVRMAPATGAENSMLVASGEEYGQDIKYLGGLFSQSQLVPTIAVSGVNESTNIMWNRQALAAVVRAPKLVEQGLGVLTQNFTDPESGVTMQFLRNYNWQYLAPEMTIRSLIGDCPAQPLWSVAILS